MKKFFFFLFFLSTLFASEFELAQKKALQLQLYKERYWHLLLHFHDGTSEINDPTFFLAPNGRVSLKAELLATLDALYHETSYDDNATACRFPARKRWLKEKLHLTNLPKVECREYKKVFERVDPKSTTLVFPSAHINSPASMFGHTFIRINSSYNSKLLAYAINYAANADAKKENAIVFSLKGLFGGYNGKYSLLPYYDKLKEYRDSENRDIWEYNLNLTQNETVRMFEHIWEIKDTKTPYYFFTDNCSYEMLWLLEVARQSLHLRDAFFFDVIPLETVHVAKKQNLLQNSTYRASKRSIIEAYKTVLDYKGIALAKKLAFANIAPKKALKFIHDKNKQRYTLELAIELTQYYYQKGELKKEQYLDIFHTLTTQRAKLKRTKKVTPKTPPNPLDGHRSKRATFGVGTIDSQKALLFGFRPAYHDLSDPLYGFLRGTQIEFLDINGYATQSSIHLDKATILSIKSIAQIDSIFAPFSWRVQLGWDREYLNTTSHFYATVGAGYSVGNSLGYIYFLLSPGFYNAKESLFVEFKGGVVIDKYSKYTNTLVEYNRRYYYDSFTQNSLSVTQTLRIKQNIALKFSYNYHERFINEEKSKEHDFSLLCSYYF